MARKVIFFALPPKQLPAPRATRLKFRLRADLTNASGCLHMKVVSASPATGTRQRLLAAASRVYARAGLTGATTRAIAAEAGVNEVTLFRHFKSKDRLLAAVVGENFGGRRAARRTAPPVPTADLRADLAALTGAYEALLTANWPLVRAMLGEMHHQLNETHEKQVFRAVFLPLKEAVVSRIETAQRAGRIQRDQRPDLLSELLLGAIFTGVLRRSIPHLKIDYSAATYREAAVAMFLSGFATAPVQP
ncbi:transcriptional regulator, TetR family [Opitutus sp. GAS368]|nr:transcriptional regulator, TetR family [Opitutus sp. GAS368]